MVQSHIEIRARGEQVQLQLGISFFRSPVEIGTAYHCEIVVVVLFDPGSLGMKRPLS